MTTDAAHGLLYKVQVAINAKYQSLILLFFRNEKLEELTLICDLTVQLILQIHEVSGQSSLSDVLNKNWNQGGSL